ncbi:isoprenylcysteine carboxylmethyltransferase family protein [Phanerochaete sordida]|uniref:Protein-S-isoprenylcysteine O-methyltransferase n=1 Tax=Phanerochaete sordida TaxID=48140 RepID=A0A9P3LHQ6_9APHY|nr:isoprenylcysteine carboxylmethyltransferase family protein [Phanerochaete sordida]
MYPVLKSILLLLSACAFQVGLTPPNAPPTQRQKVGYRGQLFEHLVYPLPWYLRNFASTMSLLHALTLLLPLLPPSSFTSILPTLCAGPTEALSELSSRFLAGTALVLGGGALRAWCYRTLGAAFTYEVAVRPDHAFITHGPYAVARHPSYPALWAIFAGGALAWRAPDAYLCACTQGRDWVRWMVWAWDGAAVVIAVGLYRRASVEDAAMRAKFGGEWEAYRRRVPWKFVPYVF